MKYIIVLSMLLLIGCGNLQKSWVEQDRDNFGALDEYEIDRMIRDASWISAEDKEALEAMNIGRRFRVRRGCDLVGVTPTAAPLRDQ